MMMKTIMKSAFLMEEIAVDLMSIQIIVTNVYVLKEEEEEGAVKEQQHLPELPLAESAIRAGLVMGIVMMSTTMKPASLI